jgi:hypothetical protein
MIRLTLKANFSVDETGRCAPNKLGEKNGAEETKEVDETVGIDGDDRVYKGGLGVVGEETTTGELGVVAEGVFREELDVGEEGETIGDVVKTLAIMLAC